MRTRALAKLTMTAAGLGLLATACSSGSGADGNNGVITRQMLPTAEFTPTALEATINDLITELGNSPPVQMTPAVVLKDVTAFWAPVVTGANRALGELGILGSVIGPTSPTADANQDTQLQLQAVQKDLTAGYDALGLAPQASTTDTDNAVDAYVAKGFPVVTLDSDEPTSMRDLYLGTINTNAGTTGGKTLLGLLPPGPGTVIVLGGSGWQDGADRTNSAEKVLLDANYTVQEIDSDFSATGETANVGALQTALMGANPPAVGMLGLFSVSYYCAEAALAAQKSGMDITNLKIVTFDFDPNTQMYMNMGLIQATQVQRAYYEGYLTPYVLYSIKALGLDKTKKILGPQMVDDYRFDTGLDTVFANQINNYSAFLNSISANTQ